MIKHKKGLVLSGRGKDRRWRKSGQAKVTIDSMGYEHDDKYPHIAIGPDIQQLEKQRMRDAPIGLGVLGAAAGGGLGHLISRNSPKHIGIGAAIGGLAGGIGGYHNELAIRKETRRLLNEKAKRRGIGKSYINQ